VGPGPLTVRDIGVAVAATVVMLAQVRIGGPAGDPTLVNPLLLAAGVGLVWRRRWPLAVACALAAVSVAQALLVGPVLPVAGWVAIVVAARHLPRWLPALGWVTAAVLAGSAAGAAVHDRLGALPIVTLLTTVVALAAALGRAYGERLDGQRRARAAELREAATAERLRLARELHDLVGHGLSTIAVQSSSARMALEAGDDAVARRALSAVEAASRGALAEMRSLVGVLRTDVGLEPAPGLDGIAALASTAHAAGVPVTVDSAVDDAVPAAVGLCAYRVVQEALTNAARHAPGAAVAISVRVDDRALRVEVADDGPGGPGGSGGSAADGRARYGLVGLRERVAAAGGTLEAGPGPGGRGWRVVARLPLAEEDAS
jgi:signal transduction histidine kinase